jgi:hypothetical protein
MVTVNDSINTLTTSTDSGGTYTISGLTQGNFTATFEKTGYVKEIVNGTLTSGQTLTLNIQLTQVPPLNITITSPQDGSVINTSPITVTGSVSNNANVTVNGFPASVSDDTFSVSIQANEGQNTLTATANDRYGQTASHSITVTLITKGSIKGIVTDSSTGLPVNSATVSVTDSLNITKTALTGSDGKYILDGIASGAFSGTITKDGFTPYSLSGSVSPGQTVTIDAPLSPAANFTVTTLGDYGNVTVMEVTGNYDAKNPDGSINMVPRQLISKEFLKTHQDTYDFFVIFSNFDFQMPDISAKGFYLGVKNDTQGIGKPLFDNSSFFGSNSKLQGIIDMGNISGHALNPAEPKFEDTLSTLTHEQMHRWGANVKFKDTNGNISSALLGKDSAHWSFLLDSDASVLYGNDWKDNGDGTFTSTGKERYYSSLDLYLMGLYDRSQVLPMLLIENTGIDAARLPEVGATITGTPRYIAIDDIITAEGERVPNASLSQKVFKTAFIFITRPDTFSGNETAGIENIRNAWAGNFVSLTNGKGSIADVAPSLTIAIISLSGGDTIYGSDVTVRGAIINSTGNETGITVNGRVATMYGNQFIANHVPLTEGLNTITVTATDTAGNSATSSITVNAVTTGHYISITSNIESGIAPLEVTLRIDGSFSITENDLDITGPVQPEILSLSPEEYTIKLIAEGIYYVTVSATGPDGNVYQDTIGIIVLNRARMDRLLQNKWEGMKTALANQDIEEALTYYSEETKLIYNDLFNALYSYLPQIAQETG